MRVCSGIGCTREVQPPETMCPSCRDAFNKKCDEYRAMRKSVANKSFEEQRDAINRFRCGGSW